MIGYQVLCRSLLIAVGSVLFAAGCAATRNADFYTLEALPAATQPMRSTADRRPLAVGIGPVTLADYLNRPQIVTRTGPNELALAEFDRWAGPPADNFKRVLAENLAILLPGDRISMFPWVSGAQVEYRVKLDVQRFDGALGDSAELVVWWTVSGRGDERPLLSRKSRLRTTVAASTYAALVAAENQLLGDFSRELAAAIKTLAAAGPAGAAAGE